MGAILLVVSTLSPLNLLDLLDLLDRQDGELIIVQASADFEGPPSSLHMSVINEPKVRVYDHQRQY